MSDAFLLIIFYGISEELSLFNAIYTFTSLVKFIGMCGLTKCSRK